MAQYLIAQSSLAARVLRMGNRGHRLYADPMSGTLIGDGMPPAAGACGTSRRVPAISDGAGAGKNNDSGSAAQGSLVRDNHVADHFDSRRRKLRQNFGLLLANIFSCRASDAGANRANLCRLDRGFPADRTHSSLKSASRRFIGYPGKVAPSDGHRCQLVILIAKEARRLRTTAVNAEEVGHGLSIVVSG